MPCSAHSEVDPVLHAFSRLQDEWIAPGLPVGHLAVPQLVLKELGLPERKFEAVARVWEEEVLRAISGTIERARERAA